MLVRILTVTCLLATAVVAWPVAAHAGSCDAVVASFYDKKDVLEVISIETSPPSNTVHILWYFNNGAFGGDSGLFGLPAQGRVRATAKAIFDGAPGSAGNPTFDSHYVKLHMFGARFSATITRDNVTRELGCVPLVP